MLRDEYGEVLESYEEEKKAQDIALTIAGLVLVGALIASPILYFVYGIFWAGAAVAFAIVCIFFASCFEVHTPEQREGLRRMWARPMHYDMPSKVPVRLSEGEKAADVQFDYENRLGALRFARKEKLEADALGITVDVLRIRKKIDRQIAEDNRANQEEIRRYKQAYVARTNASSQAFRNEPFITPMPLWPKKR